MSYRDRGIAFSPDGSRLAVATSMGVWLYDTETFDEIALLTGHKEEVTVVAFSPDGTKLAAASGFHFPGMLKFWDVETGRNIATLQVQEGSVNSVAFSPDGTKLAWAGRLWDVETKQQLDILRDKGLSNVAFSPNGKILAGTGIGAIERTRTGVVKFYDVETGQLSTPSPPHSTQNCVNGQSGSHLLRFRPTGSCWLQGQRTTEQSGCGMIETGTKYRHTLQRNRGEWQALCCV